MKKKRLYEKPAMQVYDLLQQPHLLAGSATRNPYDPTDWPE